MVSTATGRGRPTIRDVAAAAGVSRGTVSRVINGGRWVSPESRVAVERAIADTGYRTNQHARSLATGRSSSLAFLLTEPQDMLFADPNFAILLRGAAEALARRQMTLVLLVAGTPVERENAAAYVADGHVDGVLLISTHADDPLLADLVARGIPTVSCGLPLGYTGQVASVSVDEVGGARTMVRHLRSTGRRRVAMIAGPLDTPGGRYRLDGYRDELGADYDARYVAYGDYTAGSGAAAMAELLDRVPDLDAVFAASDTMAAGAIATLRKHGRRVPADVAVGGFDDAGLAATLDPPLTTMHQPFDLISAEMVGLLLDVVAGGPHKSVTMPASLVVRTSA
ncbi:LacI family DNA-binding transcriptional regulator [Cellulomonas shaoxiangyii]|uniref:LacI family transcriptional regulator n=1 Tax=Cellulomonas shaoxiangyii TaxID=2566013 RepID=A0A4P7SF34_9CELL|nr:LacI family DNA-binding transcriptional regulator [Cellulomonas shaoxiangyii]QCB92779.1 LacI family transcriptional regulator [Cellulomonas shaoxiangyii]TGY84086.1 LacI family transcriptional regulator [Cellulomonas shaoxiangyii]